MTTNIFCPIKTFFEINIIRKTRIFYFFFDLNSSFIFELLFRTEINENVFFLLSLYQNGTYNYIFFSLDHDVDFR